MLESKSQKRHEPITSRSNQWFRRFREAIERHDREIVLEGRKQLADAVNAGWRPIALAAVDGVEAPEGAFVFAPALFKALADTETTQGLVGLFERRESTLESIVKAATASVVALDGVQDPGNVGTIVRLVAAFDASGVILLEGSADAFSQKAIRASAGAVLTVPVAHATRAALIETATREGVPLFAAQRSPAASSLPPGRSILVLGSEGRGISREIAGQARAVSVAMSDRVESLNVAAATAILLAEAYARRP